jgi:very-short-patch-repair endonuclease
MPDIGVNIQILIYSYIDSDEFPLHLWERIKVRGQNLRDHTRIVNSAKYLRQQQTDAEKKLWYFLQNKNLDGLKFRRQQPIGYYIVDFVCFERKLIIELDGSQHHSTSIKNRDNRRTSWLEGEGFVVIRFWDNEILENVQGVLTVIREMTKIRHPHLTSPIQGEETRFKAKG